MIGEKYGLLTIVADEGYQGRGIGRLIRVRCECGTEKSMRRRTVLSAGAKSCGCLQKKAFDKNRTATHGHAKGGRTSPTYNTWCGMIKRCCNQSHEHYADYGGRGITVCDEWMVFENFLRDMGERPSGMTLDRENNDLGYMKSNCRWATQKQQCNNRRPHPKRPHQQKQVEYQGKIYPIDELIKRHSTIRRETVISRIRQGWNVEDALKKPLVVVRKKAA